MIFCRKKPIIIYINCPSKKVKINDFNDPLGILVDYINFYKSINTKQMNNLLLNKLKV